MNDYQLIFQKRAEDYHFAMKMFPDARKEEFYNIISKIEIQKGIHILDVPSGGGYLKDYLPNDVNLILADFSEGFAKNPIEHVKPEKLKYQSNSFDVVISISGMHHLENVSQFVRECLRVTKKGGRVVLGDVKKETNVAIFLNEFTNNYNSLGHNGDFFNENYFAAFSDIQSQIIKCSYNKYPFVFYSELEMVTFFKLFFGLDKASNKTIYEGVHDILGVKKNNHKIEVNWGLLTYVLEKLN